MKKKSKKLTARQKAVNRIKKRLETLKKKGVALKLKPTKKNIEEILKANKMKISDGNMKKTVDDFVKDAQMISREDAKRIKKQLNVKRIEDVRKLTGKELHDKIADLKDDGEDQAAEEVLEAYGY